MKETLSLFYSNYAFCLSPF